MNSELVAKNIEAIKQYTKATRELVYFRDKKIEALENNLLMTNKELELLKIQITNLRVEINKL